MDIELDKALLLLVKYCAGHDDCSNCELRTYCGKIFFEW